jgi:hypothetical protein
LSGDPDKSAHWIVNADSDRACMQRCFVEHAGLDFQAVADVRANGAAISGTTYVLEDRASLGGSAWRDSVLKGSAAKPG